MQQCVYDSVPVLTVTILYLSAKNNRRCRSTVALILVVVVVSGPRVTVLGGNDRMREAWTWNTCTQVSPARIQNYPPRALSSRLYSLECFTFMFAIHPTHNKILLGTVTVTVVKDPRQSNMI